MGRYRIDLSRAAAKRLAGLQPADARRVKAAIDSLGDAPRPPGCKKLEGTPRDLWRIRSGSFRVIYLVDDKHLLVTIAAVADRKDAYR